MTPQERLTLAAQALTAYNPEHIDAISDMKPEDLARLSTDYGLREEDFPKLIGTMIYIRKRLVEKNSRTASFKAAFPERCIATDHGQTLSEYGSVTPLGEELTATTINVKAKRLENSQMYIHVYQLLQTNLYINYAVDRLRVLDEALAMSLDPHVTPRDRHNYMKLFLDKTEKPETAKGLEFNLNITNNDVSVISVEEKMTGIANQMKNLNAAQIIEMVHQEKQDDS